MHDDRHRRHRHERDRGEILHGVVGQLLIEGRVDGVGADRRHQQRLAVRRGLGDGVGAERAARPAAVVDQHGALQFVGQHLRQGPRDDVGRPAGRERNDQADLLAGEGLRLCGSGADEPARPCRCKKQELSALHIEEPPFLNTGRCRRLIGGIDNDTTLPPSGLSSARGSPAISRSWEVDEREAARSPASAIARARHLRIRTSPLCVRARRTLLRAPAQQAATPRYRPNRQQIPDAGRRTGLGQPF